MVEEYPVVSGDTLDAIARAHGLRSYEDLLSLNRFLKDSDKEPDIFSKKRKKESTIFPGEILKVPKKGSLEMLEKEFESIREYARIREYNQKVNR